MIPGYDLEQIKSEAAFSNSMDPRIRFLLREVLKRDIEIDELKRQLEEETHPKVKQRKALIASEKNRQESIRSVADVRVEELRNVRYRDFVDVAKELGYSENTALRARQYVQGKGRGRKPATKTVGENPKRGQIGPSAWKVLAEVTRRNLKPPKQPLPSALKDAFVAAHKASY